MTTYTKSLATIFIIPLVTISLLAQVIIKRNGKGGELDGQPFMLQEVGAVIIATDGALAIEHVMAHENRPKAYTDIDLREGDNILMVNAKKVTSTKQLEQIYNSLAVGGELKLGIKRKDEMFIVTLAKADQSHLPKMKIQIGGDDDIAAFPALGILLKEVNGKVIVADKLPDTTSALYKANVLRKDELAEMNGKPVRTLKAFDDAYSTLPVGSMIDMTLNRVGKSISLSFKKPQPRGMMIRREIK